MAYKRDIIPWLKENGYTWQDIDRIWNECCEVNILCNKLAMLGKDWSELSMYAIKQLPTLKEETLKAQAKAKEEERKNQEEEQKRKDYEKYYATHFESILVEKIDKGEDLTESELVDMLQCSIERSYGDVDRWTRAVYDICELEGRFFCLKWEKGLNENQSNNFFNQPYEVYPNKVVKVVESTSYSRYKKADEFKEFHFSSTEESELLRMVRDMLCGDKDIKVIKTGEDLIIRTNS